ARAPARRARAPSTRTSRSPSEAQDSPLPGAGAPPRGAWGQSRCGGGTDLHAIAKKVRQMCAKSAARAAPREGPLGCRCDVRVLVVTNMYPTRERPALGPFVRDQVEALRRRGDLEVELYA